MPNEWGYWTYKMSLGRNSLFPLTFTCSASPHSQRLTMRTERSRIRHEEINHSYHSYNTPLNPVEVSHSARRRLIRPPTLSLSVCLFPCVTRLTAKQPRCFFFQSCGCCAQFHFTGPQLESCFNRLWLKITLHHCALSLCLVSERGLRNYESN